jgi:hypothetical protein
MSFAAAQVALAFSKELQKIPREWADRQRRSRRLLKVDPLEQLVPAKLLGEGLQKLLDELTPSSNPTVLFMDRAGGGEGAKTAGDLMPLLSKRWSGASFVHVSFATPARGVGVLARSVLVSAAARCGVDAHVVAYNRPVQGLKLAQNDVDAIAGSCKLIITYTPGGAAGLVEPKDSICSDPLIEQSHLVVQSYPDPESLIGGLSTLKLLSKNEPAIETIKFYVQIQTDETFRDLGVATLGPGGDAEDRLWMLIENARRHRYRVLVEPLSGDQPSGDPIVCPCRTVIHEELSAFAAVQRIVPAGSILVAVARGRSTLL